MKVISHNCPVLSTFVSFSAVILLVFPGDLRSQFISINERQNLFSLPITFERTFGDSGDDYAHSVQRTADGGYIITGRTSSSGSGDFDVYLLKTDPFGNEEWSRTFGGTGEDFAHSVEQTPDGGYILGGRTFSFGAGDLDFYLIKTDPDGDEEWSRTFGGTGDDHAYALGLTADGGYILTGLTASFGAGNSDVYLIKTDSTGTEEWSRTFGGIEVDYAYSVEQTADGGYILAGGTRSFGAGYYDVYLIKTDSNGDEEWSQTFGGTEDEYAYSVRQIPDGSYILAGATWSYGAGFRDAYLIKTDSNGNEEWSRTFGGTGDEKAYSVEQTTDGGYILAGRTSSFGTGEYAVYLIKTDPEGYEEWSRTFGGSEDDDASSSSVRQTPDRGYVIAGGIFFSGVENADVYLIKTDRNGNL